MLAQALTFQSRLSQQDWVEGPARSRPRSRGDYRGSGRCRGGAGWDDSLTPGVGSLPLREDGERW